MLIEEQKADEVVETPEEAVVETAVTPEAPAEEVAPVETPAEEEVSVTIEGVTPPQEEADPVPAPKWAKELRKNFRELQREKRELEEKLNSLSKTEPNPVDLGAEPTLEGVDYDVDKYKAELEAWLNRKRLKDLEVQKAEIARLEQQAAWQKKVAGYSERKSALKVSDFDEAENVVLSTMDATKQGIIIQGAENPALLIYAIGKNPQKAKELAAISDPVQFAFEIARLETKIKTAPRKAAPPPEKVVVAGTANVTNFEKELDRLRDEAARTGDYSKVVAFKKQLKSQ